MILNQIIAIEGLSRKKPWVIKSDKFSHILLTNYLDVRTCESQGEFDIISKDT